MWAGPENGEMAPFFIWLHCSTAWSCSIDLHFELLHLSAAWSGSIALQLGAAPLLYTWSCSIALQFGVAPLLYRLEWFHCSTTIMHHAFNC